MTAIVGVLVIAVFALGSWQWTLAKEIEFLREVILNIAQEVRKGGHDAAA